MILKIKGVSFESFFRFGFYFGLLFGVIGILLSFLFPSVGVTTYIPFLNYNLVRSFTGAILWFIIAVTFSVIDFLLIALLLNLIFKLSKGMVIYVEKEE